MSGPHTNGTKWCQECGLWSKPPCRATDYCALRVRASRERRALRVARQALDAIGGSTTDPLAFKWADEALKRIAAIRKGRA